MSRYKPYPKYKDSGITWLGEIPEHWGIKKLKYLAKINPSKSEVSRLLSANIEVQFLSMELVSEDGRICLSETRGLSEVYQGFTYFRNDDVLLAKITPCFENGKGAVVEKVKSGIGFGSTEFHVIRPFGRFSKYIWYITKSHPFRKIGILEMKGVAGQQRVPEDFVSDFLIAEPTDDEKNHISSFLNHQTAKIDQLIKKKERFIELLREKRSALITSAVTGKFDVRTGKPYPKYKDSGIEWLGEVPEHWNVRRIKDVGHLVAGSGFPHEYQNIQGEEIYFYKVSDLSSSLDEKYLRESQHTISRKMAQELGAKIIPPGAIVYAKIGAALLLNRRRITTRNCCIDNNMSAYIPDNRSIVTEWAFRWLSIIDFSEHVNPGAVPSFGEGYQAALPIYVPPKEDQHLITNFLNHQTAKIDRLIEKTRQSIDLLKEKRAALITASVTGKIDVRDWKPEAA